MMKELIAFGTISLCCTSGYGQGSLYIEEPKTFSGALVAGANFTQVDGDSFYGYEKVGLNAGGLVYMRFSDHFGAAMEISYSQKGSRGEQVSNGAAGIYVEKYFMDLNYVEVPVTLHLKTVLRSHYVYGEAGLSYAYLVNSKEWVETDQLVIIDPVANRFNSTDLDYIIGANVQVYKKLYANARFQYSITDVRPEDRVPAGFSYGSKGQFNNMMNLRLMYFF